MGVAATQDSTSEWRELGAQVNRILLLDQRDGKEDPVCFRMSGAEMRRSAVSRSACIVWSGQTEAPLDANDDDDDPLSQKVH